MLSEPAGTNALLFSSSSILRMRSMWFMIKANTKHVFFAGNKKKLVPWNNSFPFQLSTSAWQPEYSDGQVVCQRCALLLLSRLSLWVVLNYCSFKNIIPLIKNKIISPCFWDRIFKFSGLFRTFPNRLYTMY